MNKDTMKLAAKVIGSDELQRQNSLHSGFRKFCKSDSVLPQFVLPFSPDTHFHFLMLPWFVDPHDNLQKFKIS